MSFNLQKINFYSSVSDFSENYAYGKFFFYYHIFGILGKEELYIMEILLSQAHFYLFQLGYEFFQLSVAEKPHKPFMLICSAFIYYL